MAIRLRLRTFLHAVHRRILTFHTRLGRWAVPVWAASAIAALGLCILLLVVPGPGGIRSAADM
ncbi:MAG: hypothetical protein NUW22_14490, partial [Acidobacteria bacterium]|nr:hypothetical protein [Acidobacteriota bacterium]